MVSAASLVLKLSIKEFRWG